MTSSEAHLPSTSRVCADPTYRIIPTLYPPLDLFESLAPAEDWDDLAELESLTNDRLRDELGDISVVPLDERVSGAGATTIMAAFTHAGSSRFSDGSYGVYYAALDQETAIYESAHSRARFYADSHEPPTNFDMRVHCGTVDADLHDVRGRFPEVHDPCSHVAAQALGSQLRAAKSYGIAYDSARKSGGECIAIFRPSALRNDKPQGHTWQGAIFKYHWDGTRVTKYFDHRLQEWIEF